MPLTISKIKALEPKPARYLVADSNGLCLEVWPSGRMSWRYRFRLNGKPAKFNLGRYPEMSLAAARQKRDEEAAAIRRGDSPVELRRKERAKALRSVTVREFGERYYTEIVKKSRKEPRTVLRYLEREVYPALGAMPIGKVNAQDVQEIIFRKCGEGHEHAGLAIRNLIKRIWDYAIVRGAATENPAKATPAKYIATSQARSRTLTNKEIRVFLTALDTAPIDERYKIAFQLILLNLVRKSELRKAAWAHIDLDKGEWVIPPENAKNQKELLILLSSQAIELFRRLRALNPDGLLVLPMAKSRTQPISGSTLNRALQAVPTRLAHFTIHDLRRTGSTLLSEMEYDERWVEKALNHTKKGVSGIYNRAEYAKQRRQMLQAWADHVDQLKGKP